MFCGYLRANRSNKDLLEVIKKALTGVYQAAKTKVGVGLDLSERFWAQINVQERPVLSLLLFVIGVDTISLQSVHAKA